MKSNFLKNSITYIIIIIVILGFYTSYKTSFGIISINSDVFDTGLLWQGIHRYGWQFLKTWNYNWDNWLFSLLPIHYLIFKLFGPSTWSMLWFGYIIFLANIFVCCWIAYELGTRIAPFFIAIYLLFSNYFFYSGGMLTFPITHNSTNLYGLICLLLFLRWVKNPSWIYSLIIFFLMFIAGVSDPWLIPTYLLPILITQLCLIKKFWEYPKMEVPSTLSIILCFLALILISTKLFGLLNFSYRSQESVFSIKYVLTNLKYLIKNIGWSFNLTPGVFNIQHYEKLLPCLINFLSILLIAVSINRMVFTKNQNNIQLISFYQISNFSIFLISAGFILLNSFGQNFWNIYNLRYLINIPFLLTLGILISLELHWSLYNKFFKTFCILVGALFLFSSISSTSYLWVKKINVDKQNFNALGKFLFKNNLTYGYAQFWKSHIITWITHDKVIVRPLKFSDTTGMVASDLPPQTSKLWYLPSDLPKSYNRYFIIVEKEYSLCTNKESCVKKLSTQFGPPSEVLNYENYFIMVWPHPLLQQIFS